MNNTHNIVTMERRLSHLDNNVYGRSVPCCRCCCCCFFRHAQLNANIYFYLSFVFFSFASPIEFKILAKYLFIWRTSISSNCSFFHYHHCYYYYHSNSPVMNITGELRRTQKFPSLQSQWRQSLPLSTIRSFQEAHLWEVTVIAWHNERAFFCTDNKLVC